MPLRRALGWAGVQTGVRMLLGLVSAKISAVYLGPPGVALVGQLGSLIQVAQGAIGNGAATAVVNLTAQRRGSEDELARLWSTALRVVLVLAGLMALALALASRPLSAWLLTDAQFWPVMIAAGAAVVLLVADSVLLAALNGLKQVDLVAKAGIASAVVEVGLYASLVYAFGLWGGLFGIAIIHGAKLAVSSVIAFRSGLVPLRALFSRMDGDTARAILPFYPMLLAHSIAQPLGQILVRDGVIGTLGLAQAGLLQSAWRLSDMYVGVLTAALSLYFMAHYSALASGRERAALLRRTVLQLTLLTALAAAVVYLLRDLVIRLVLTAEFLPMGDLLPLHLLGDVFKMAAYPLMMALTAQRMTRWYIALAAGGPAGFVVLSQVALPAFGVQAAPAAYAVSQFAVLLVLLLGLGRRLMATKVE